MKKLILLSVLLMLNWTMIYAQSNETQPNELTPSSENEGLLAALEAITAEAIDLAVQEVRESEAAARAELRAEIYRLEEENRGLIGQASRFRTAFFISAGVVVGIGVFAWLK